jgi:opacity protein-like surface antigen
MYKLIVASAVAAMSLSVSAVENAEVTSVPAANEIVTKDVGSFGIGYQGVMYDNATLNAMSFRWNPSRLGGQILLGQMYSEVSDSEAETTWFTLQGKVLYTLIQRSNSSFYIGGKLGFMIEDEKDDAGISLEDKDAWVLGALLGTEWRFSELPEIGFNFEVGYDLVNSDDNGTEEDMNGIVVSVGANYYF